MNLSQKIFLRNPEGKILAIRRSHTDPHRPLTWDLPGGIVEHGEDLLENIKRETLEEVGIMLENFSILGALSALWLNGVYAIQIAYIAIVDDPEIQLSYEHDEYRWLTKEEFLELESTHKIKKFLQML